MSTVLTAYCSSYTMFPLVPCPFLRSLYCAFRPFPFVSCLFSFGLGILTVVPIFYRLSFVVFPVSPVLSLIFALTVFCVLCTFGRSSVALFVLDRLSFLRCLSSFVSCRCPSSCSRKCQVEGGGCDRQPVYGWPGDRATRCGTHKLERTVRIYAYL